MASSNISKQIERIADLDVEEVTMRPSLGDKNFADAQKSLAGVVAIAKAIRDFDFESLPLRYQNNLTENLQNFHGAVEALRTFNLDAENPTQRRNQLENNFENQTAALYDVLLPAITILSTRDIGGQRQRAEEALQSINKIGSEAQTALKAIQKTSAEAGVSREARHFSVQAKEHRNAGFFWLAVTALLAVATVLWGFIALYCLKLPHDASNVEIVQNTVGKLIVLSGLYFSLVWSGKNYRASRHNYVVNKHRENSLSTFETFASAASNDEGIKNAVLLQATTSIFSSQPSGYSQNDPESDSPSKIIELSKTIYPKSSA